MGGKHGIVLITSIGFFMVFHGIIELWTMGAMGPIEGWISWGDERKEAAELSLVWSIKCAKIIRFETKKHKTQVWVWPCVISSSSYHFLCVLESGHTAKPHRNSSPNESACQHPHMVMGMSQKGITIKQTTNLMKLRCHGKPKIGHPLWAAQGSWAVGPRIGVMGCALGSGRPMFLYQLWVKLTDHHRMTGYLGQF